MLATLKYPFNPRTPTVTVQLILDTNTAKPSVAETVSIGFPFELTQIVLSASYSIGNTYNVYLMAAYNPFVAGDPLAEQHLVQITGDQLTNDQRYIPFLASGELILRPRIRVPRAGTRLRMVHTEAVFISNLRALITLTPLS